MTVRAHNRARASFDDHVLIFLHVPKSAGSTLTTCVYNEYQDVSLARDGDKFYSNGVYYFPAGFYKTDSAEPPRFVLERLPDYPLRAVVGHLTFGLHRYLRQPCRYVTVLRDPIERIASLYHHLVTTGHLSANVTLDEFVAECSENGWNRPLVAEHVNADELDERELRRASRRIVDNDQTRRVAGVEPAFGECSAATLALAKTNLREHFAFVGTTERFDETLVMMKRTLGWRQPLCYLPKLVNYDRRAAGSIAPTTRELIAARHRWDLELYTFARELQEASMAAAGDAFARELGEFQAHNRQHIARHASAIAALGLGDTSLTGRVTR